jgi:hypothetical protein
MNSTVKDVEGVVAVRDRLSYPPEPVPSRADLDLD